VKPSECELRIADSDFESVLKLNAKDQIAGANSQTQMGQKAESQLKTLSEA